jgi:hypothetical protein
LYEQSEGTKHTNKHESLWIHKRQNAYLHDIEALVADLRRVDNTEKTHTRLARSEFNSRYTLFCFRSAVVLFANNLGL